MAGALITARRVLFVLPNLQGGGTERVVLTLLRHLDRSRIQPSLFLIKRSGVYWDELPPDLPVAWASDDTHRMRSRPLELVRTLTRLGRENDIVVGCLELDSTYLAWVIGILARKPVVGWVHTLIRPYLRRVPARHAVLVRAIYPRLSTIVFPSNSAADDFEQMAPLSSSRRFVISNPFDAERVLEMSTRPVRSLPEAVFDSPLLMGIGRLEPAKNFDQLVKAMAILRERGKNWNLIILGDGPERQRLEQMTAGYGLAGRVFLPGFFSNPYPLMSRASILMHPSAYEGFGMTILEALQLGIPVIAAAGSGAPEEILDRGRYGRLVNPNDPGALADAAVSLVESPEATRQLALGGPARAAQFAAGQAAARWEELLQQL